MNYVALIADSNGRYANIIVPATSWDHAIDQLEDIGCEVVECQSDDYEEDDFKDEESLREAGLLTISDLLKKTAFVPF
jgi:threonine dehydratase